MTDPNHELSVTRLIDAPREVVWKVITERLPDWWAPKPWTTEIEAVEFRPGGRLAMVMRGTEPGETSPIDGIILEFVPGERIAFTNAIAAGSQPRSPAPVNMIGIFSLADEGGRTRYTAVSRHWDADAAKAHDEMGFSEGWGMCADQLKELAEAEVAGA